MTHKRVTLISLSLLMALAALIAMMRVGRAETTHAVSLAAGPGQFEDSGQLLGTASSADVALGDVDGDGDPDAFVANLDRPHSLWLNQGGAQEGTPGIFLDSGQSLGSSGGRSVKLGDLDGDGDLDAFVVTASPLGDANQVFINQGGAQEGFAGIFLASGQNFGSANGTAVALGDLDEDWKLDAYVSHRLGWIDKVWKGDGNGIFTDTLQTLEDEQSFDVDLGDLDGDGDLDAFLANEAANKVWINQGGAQSGVPGIFLDSGQVLTSGRSLGVVLADVDGDLDLDAYLANNTADELWLNQGGAQEGVLGVFQNSGQSLSARTPSNDAALADVDSDGDLDAFVAKASGNELWINQGGSQGGEQGVFLDSGERMGSGFSRAVAMADLDGDGDLDAFVAKSDGPNEVWLNRGRTITGCFADSLQRLGSSASLDVLLGDLDLDGDLDAFVAGDGPNEVWLNDGGGSFISNGQLLGGCCSASAGAALGDVDGDADLDVIVANLIVNNTVWLNNGSGILSYSSQNIAGLSSLDVSLADLDGDDDLDAFFANGSIDNGQPLGVPNTVWINQGGAQGGSEGTFLDSGQSLGGDYSQGIALGDLDGDGDTDAFVANYGASKIWLNDGSGNYNDSGQNISAFSGTGVALGDLDGDGDLDAFITQGGSKDEVWLNDGTGVFFDSGQRLDDQWGSRVALGDLDGDGDLDAFVANGQKFGQANTVWLNGESGLNPGEFIDSQQRLGNSSSTAVALGDLDGDGDLDTFIGNWSSMGDVPNEVWINGRCCTLEWLAREGGMPTASANEMKRAMPQAGLLGQVLIDLQLFFRVRDELLNQTPAGRHYINLYYRNELEIFRLLLTNPALRDEGVSALSQWESSLKALLDGQGNGITISASQVQAVDDFLTNLYAVASPTLQQVIDEELAKLPPLGDFIGMTLEEVRGLLLPYVTFLPAVQAP